MCSSPQIVTFDNLTPVQLREIVRNMAKEIGSRLRSRNITLVMTDRALDAVVQIVRYLPPLLPSKFPVPARPPHCPITGAAADAAAGSDADKICDCRCAELCVLFPCCCVSCCPPVTLHLRPHGSASPSQCVTRLLLVNRHTTPDLAPGHCGVGWSTTWSRSCRAW